MFTNWVTRLHGRFAVASRSLKIKPYRPPEDVELRLEKVAMRTLPNFTNLSETFTFPDRRSKVKFLKACMQEFDHTIPSYVLCELEDTLSVKDYFMQKVEPQDKLVAMIKEHSDHNNLPPNLVVQADPIRYNPNDKSLFPTTAFPGRSTIVSGIESSRRYPSYKVSKYRRVRVDAADRV